MRRVSPRIPPANRLPKPRPAPTPARSSRRLVAATAEMPASAGLGALGLAAVLTVWSGLAATPALAQESPEPAAPPTAARWEGSIAISEEQEEPLVLHLARSPEGTWSGTVGLPDSGAEAAPLVDVVVDGDQLSFSAPSLPDSPIFTAFFEDNFEIIAGDVSREVPPPPPPTDIHLLTIAADGPAGTGGAASSLGAPRPAVQRDGYDNQPRFLPDSSGFLYTSIRDGQADVYLYDFRSGGSRRVTDTAESEYSPTPLGDGDTFSTVRVEADGTQRLWRFPMSGGEPELLLPEVAPVGYHGWLGDGRVALFVLGSPPTLEIVDPASGERQRVAESVGRAIQEAPGGGQLTFVHKAAEEDWTIELLDLESGERRTLIRTLPGSEDFTWSADGRLLMGRESKLYACSPDDEAPAWTEIADLAKHGIEGITRLDASPDGRWLAVVGNRPSDDAGPPPRARHLFELRRVAAEP